MELVGRADPPLGTTLADVLGDADVVVDFTAPDTALENALRVPRGRRPRRDRHDRLRPRAAARRRGGGANVFVAPNFAIGAVLMMRFAAEAARHMAEGRDHRAAPRPQARRAERHRRAHRRADGAAAGGDGAADPLGAPARASSPTRRSSSATSARRSRSATTRSTASRSCPACCWRCAASADARAARRAVGLRSLLFPMTRRPT